MSCGSSSIMKKGSPTSSCNVANNGGGCNGEGGTFDCNFTGISQRKNRGKVIEEIKDSVMLLLGAPTLDLELDQQQLDFCVNQTLRIMELYAPKSLARYYTFFTTPGKTIYEMPPDVGYVRNVYFRQTDDFNFQSTDLQGAIPLEYFAAGFYGTDGGFMNPAQPVFGKMGDWVNFKAASRNYSKLSSGIGGWEFVGGYRHIKLYPASSISKPVVVHYTQKCHDWDDVHYLAIEGTYALAMMALGMIRKKYNVSLGPSGGVTLDGAEMYQTGAAAYEKFKMDIMDRWVDPYGPVYG